MHLAVFIIYTLSFEETRAPGHSAQKVGRDLTSGYRDAQLGECGSHNGTEGPLGDNFSKVPGTNIEHERGQQGAYPITGQPSHLEVSKNALARIPVAEEKNMKNISKKLHSEPHHCGPGSPENTSCVKNRGEHFLSSLLSQDSCKAKLPSLSAFGVSDR